MKAPILVASLFLLLSALPAWSQEDKKAEAFKLNEAAIKAEAEKRYDDAEKLYQQALDAKTAAVGADSPELAPIMFNLARFEAARGKRDLARPLFESAINIRRKDSSAVGQAELAVTLTSYAQLLADAGDTEKAEAGLREALKLLTAAVGEEDNATLRAKTNLATFLMRSKNLDESAKLYSQVVETFRKRKHADEPYAAALTNMASILRKQEKFEEADPYAREAVTVLQGLQPPDDKRLITAQSNLAKLLKDESQFDEAKKLLEGMLPQIEKVYGPGSDRAMSPLTDLAELAAMKGDTDTSVNLLEQALEIGKKSLPADSQDLATAEENLANAYRDAGKYDKALPLYQDFVEKQKKLHGEVSKETADAMDDIALMARDQNAASAEGTFKDVIAIREKLASVDPGALATSLNNVGKLYRDEGKYEDAEAAFKRALDLRQKTFGPKDSSVAATLRNYALLMRKKGDEKKAAELDAQAESIEASM